MTLTDGRIGQLLDGKYRLVELLARGGMGIVYGARHEATGRVVAVKILRAELVTRPHLVQRVVAEARLAVEASHPNVVEVLDAGTERGGMPYLVLERLFGHTLENILSRPLPLLETVQALVPVMNAICALHRAGIVHRDIKPSNLFLARDAHGRVTPKLLDFGIAKALEVTGSTLSGVALGTPAYMAPEQALGYRTLGPPTDVWAMGVTLARCLTAKLPFDAAPANRAGALRGDLDERDFPGVAAPVAGVLSRALRFEPTERFDSMSEFRQALFDALRSLDASLRWPNETTVSHTADESELSAYVAAVVPEPSSVDDAEPVRQGREIHVETRTLSSAERPEPRARRRRLLSFAALGLSVIALAFLFLRSTLRGSSEAASAAFVAPAGPAPALSRVVRLPAANVEPPEPRGAPIAATIDETSSGAPHGRTVVPPTSTAGARGPASAPVSQREAERAVESFPATPAAGSTGLPIPAAASEPPPSDSERKLTVGANRSPIIE